MNRRTLLQSAGALAVVALAGCLDDDDGGDGLFQNPFDGVGLQRPVSVEMVSEAENAYNVQLDAFERGTTRGTYEEAYTVTPGERVVAPHLDTTEQRFRVTRLGGDDDDLVEETAIGEHSRLVLIRIDDAELEVDVIEDEEEAEEEQEELEDDDFDERDEDDGDPN